MPGAAFTWGGGGGCCEFTLFIFMSKVYEAGICVCYLANASFPAEDVCFEMSVYFLTWLFWLMLALKALVFIILIRLFLPRVAVGCPRFGRNLLPGKCSVYEEV
jgi:hypothetical protein